MLKRAGGDLSGAVADLGVFVPLAAALILVNGLHPGPLLLVAGLLSLGAGLWFRIPFPVQPLKALTALAVAQQLPLEVIHAAGLLIGAVLVAASLTGAADRLAALFTKPVIRSLQLAVGVLLMLTAMDLARNPPSLFAGPLAGTWALTLALLTAIGVGVAVHRRQHLAVVLVLASATIVAWALDPPVLGGIVVLVPQLSVPSTGVWATAFVLLVIPQLPLTFGNAVVGVSDLAREHFPTATRVTPGRVALSCGLGNLTSALLSGMPMCHGSSGLTAHVRLGARTAGMNVLLGGTLVALGLFFSQQVLALFALLPVWALAGFLGYAGLRHALLVLDLGGSRLLLACLAALVGIWTGNLASTTAVALAVEWLPRAMRRVPGAGRTERARVTSRRRIPTSG